MVFYLKHFQVNLRKLITIDENKAIYSSNLTLLQRGKQLQTDEINLCPMDTKAYVIHR
jgi:hypothetical protein